MSAQIILGFDTSGPHCAAALLHHDRIVVSRMEGMVRGQAERLMPLLEEVLAEAGLQWNALDAIGVGVGPGNFTGIRIGVAAARGLSLALGIPAVGVSNFEIMRGLDCSDAPERQLVSLPAPRGTFYLQFFAAERPAGGPVQLPPHGHDTPSRRDLEPFALQATDLILGHEADLLSGQYSPNDASRPRAITAELPTVELAPRLARIAAAKLATGVDQPRPAPLYVRAPDAAPARETPPGLIP